MTDTLSNVRGYRELLSKKAGIRVNPIPSVDVNAIDIKDPAPGSKKDTERYKNYNLETDFKLERFQRVCHSTEKKHIRIPTMFTNSHSKRLSL